MQSAAFRSSPLPAAFPPLYLPYFPEKDSVYYAVLKAVLKILLSQTARIPAGFSRTSFFFRFIDIHRLKEAFRCSGCFSTVGPVIPATPRPAFPTEKQVLCPAAVPVLPLILNLLIWQKVLTIVQRYVSVAFGQSRSFRTMQVRITRKLDSTIRKGG